MDEVLVALSHFVANMLWIAGIMSILLAIPAYSKIRQIMERIDHGRTLEALRFEAEKRDLEDREMRRLLAQPEAVTDERRR